MALTKKDQELIAQMVAQTVAAMVPNLGGAQAPPLQEPEPETANPDAADMEEIRRSEAEQRERSEHVDELVRALIPLIMQPRHLEVFIWFSGDNWSASVTQILRAEVARRMPDYREAKGGGGSSSRNIEALSERLPVKK